MEPLEETMENRVLIHINAVVFKTDSESLF